jgi:hypothetical protein
VSLDDAPHRKQWLRALADYQMPGTPASNLDGPSGGTAQRYRIGAPVQNFLFDPTGRILAFNLYGEELAAALAKYMPPARPGPKASAN